MYWSIGWRLLQRFVAFPQQDQPLLLTVVEEPPLLKKVLKASRRISVYPRSPLWRTRLGSRRSPAPPTRSFQFFKIEELFAPEHARTRVLSLKWLYVWKPDSHDVYLTRSGLSRPGVFFLITNLLVTILQARTHGSFSTSPIKPFHHWSQFLFIPRLKAAFALSHASCSRVYPFDWVNFHRPARHTRRRAANWSFHQKNRALDMSVLSARPWVN